LSSAVVKALGKDTGEGAHLRVLCRVPVRQTLGTGTGGGAHWTSLCRVPQKTLGKGSVTVTWRRDGDFSLPSAKCHSAKSLPSARQKVLGKEAVADVQFVERSLPSVTLGKAFAECKIAFAVCLRHTAKELIPVVFSRFYLAHDIQTCPKNKFLYHIDFLMRANVNLLRGLNFDVTNRQRIVLSVSVKRSRDKPNIMYTLQQQKL
jgi:hypothetical protein